MKNGDKPIANPFVVLREEFDDWAILFNPDTGRGFGLSPTGVYVWKLLDGEHTIDALLERSTASAEGVPDEARDHIGAFIDALVKEDLAGLGSTPHSVLNTASGQQKRSSPPPIQQGEAKPLSYETLRLVYFREGRKAHGSCGHGSGDATSCSGGHAAGCCPSTGTSGWSNSCQTCTGCMDGNTNFGGCCDNGCALASSCSMGPTDANGCGPGCIDATCGCAVSGGFRTSCATYGSCV